MSGKDRVRNRKESEIDLCIQRVLAYDKDDILTQ